MSKVLDDLELMLKALDAEQPNELKRELEAVLMRAKAHGHVRSGKRRPSDYFGRIAGVLKGETF